MPDHFWFNMRLNEKCLNENRKDIFNLLLKIPFLYVFSFF